MDNQNNGLTSAGDIIYDAYVFHFLQNKKLT